MVLFLSPVGNLDSFRFPARGFRTDKSSLKHSGSIFPRPPAPILLDLACRAPAVTPHPSPRAHGAGCYESYVSIRVSAVHSACSPTNWRRAVPVEKFTRRKDMTEESPTRRGVQHRPVDTLFSHPWVHLSGDDAVEPGCPRRHRRNPSVGRNSRLGDQPTGNWILPDYAGPSDWQVGSAERFFSERAATSTFPWPPAVNAGLQHRWNDSRMARPEPHEVRFYIPAGKWTRCCTKARGWLPWSLLVGGFLAMNPFQCMRSRPAASL